MPLQDSFVQQPVPSNVATPGPCTDVACGVTAQWQGVRTIQTAALQPDDNDVLWDKVYNNVPLTEAEIARLK